MSSQSPDSFQGSPRRLVRKAPVERCRSNVLGAPCEERPFLEDDLYLDERGALLRGCTIVHATLIAASSSTKNKETNAIPRCTSRRGPPVVFPWISDIEERQIRLMMEFTPRPLPLGIVTG